MPIVLESPVVKTYDVVWVKSLTVKAPNPSDNAPIELVATFGFVAKNSNGVGEFLPDVNVTMQIDDLNTELANNAQLGQVFQTVLGSLIVMAKARGLLPNIVVQ